MLIILLSNFSVKCFNIAITSLQCPATYVDTHSLNTNIICQILNSQWNENWILGNGEWDYQCCEPHQIRQSPSL